MAKDYVKDLEGMVPNTPANQDLLTDFTDLLTESIDGTSRIASIVADLKTFSSIDQADYSRCDINSLLISAIHLVQTEYNHEMQITEELRELPAIDGHPSKLSQTFFSLLDNAAQAIRDAEPEKRSEKGRILVKTLVQGSDVQVTIQDNGCGIPEKNRKRVFDAFFTSRPVGSGTGLGLTVAQDTVRAHSGHLQIDTREGTGTRVLLTLPIN